MAELRRSARVAAGKREPPKIEEDDGPIEAVAPLKKKLKVTPTVAKKLKKETKPIEDGTSDTANDSDATAESVELQVGDEIPDMTLQNQDGKKVSLRKIAKENKVIIIFTYPKASTPGCTRQACGFRDNYDDLKAHAAVFGLSGDAVDAQKKFQTKQNLPYDLLSDPKRTLIGYLGAKKTPQSGTIRSHFVFVNGKLKFKRVKISPEVSVQDGKKEVLELAKKFEKS